MCIIVLFSFSFYIVGALFGFQMLCIMLGRLFEPYVVHILPDLLICFGNSSISIQKVNIGSYIQSSVLVMDYII